MITQIVASNTQEEMNDFFLENVEKNYHLSFQEWPPWLSYSSQ